MYKQVEFCDLCNSNGVYHLASAEYVTPELERVVVCVSCTQMVIAAGLSTKVLGLSDYFLEDIWEGLKDDTRATERAALTEKA